MSIKFYSIDVKAIVTKKLRVTFCENIVGRNFFKMDPYYPNTLHVTFLNYMAERKEENKKYNFPYLTRLHLSKFSGTQKFKQAEIHKLLKKFLGGFGGGEGGLVPHNI